MGGGIGWSDGAGAPTINSVLLRIPANSPLSVLNMSAFFFLSKNFSQNFGFTMVYYVVRLRAYGR